MRSEQVQVPEASKSAESSLQTRNSASPLNQGPVLWWHWTFATWEPENRHWVAPSELWIYSDASIRFTARRLASMWRWPGPIDGGPGFVFSARIPLFDDQKVNFITLGFDFAHVPYRQELNNYDITRSYPHLFPYLDRARDALAERWIEKERASNDGVVLPLPPIPFP